ncbi:hypothetical protein [Myxococcus sp. AB056]|uniref:hypothetical protein n=2 Tax=unclassified Myxococcus TaxID=2648731 RepID=UPI001E2ACCC4|nr:hypothetical protein [Myxococcus sp. AB056]
MSSSEQTQTVMALAEIFVPLAVGIIQGILVMKFVKPLLMERLGGLAGLVRSRANTFFGIVQMLLLLGVVAACNAAYAPQTLAWLQERDILPFEPTLLVLRITVILASYLIGTNLVHLASALSDDTESNTLEPLPLNDRRQR